MIDSLHQIIEKSGFELYGITKAKISQPDRENIQEFIDKKFYGTMKWFPDRQNIRVDMENLGFPVESILVLGCVYKPSQNSEDSMSDLKDKISRYAWGEDYHHVLRSKAEPILRYLKDQYPNRKFRQGVDSLPIPEKILARNAGLGWIGKNTLLIHPDLGSYFFLTCILCEADLTAVEDFSDTNKDSKDETGGAKNLFQQTVQQTDRCGTCRACITACPTGAIVDEYKLDAGKCISHHTIEIKDDKFPPDVDTHSWVFGCDICQEVCPWNRIKAKKRNVETKEERFAPLDVWKQGMEQLKGISREEFIQAFDKSPLLRTGYNAWRRNWEFSEN